MSTLGSQQTALVPPRAAPVRLTTAAYLRKPKRALCCPPSRNCTVRTRHVSAHAMSVSHTYWSSAASKHDGEAAAPGVASLVGSVAYGRVDYLGQPELIGTEQAKYPSKLSLPEAPLIGSLSSNTK